ncbi:hypothetical protein ACA910_014071 [Epithemia clementina (nom. ined.)]
MTTTLGTIETIKRSSSIHIGTGKDMRSPDFTAVRPKSATSLGNGSVSRTDGSTEFSVAACNRYSNTECSENINNKHILSVPASGHSSRQIPETRNPLTAVVGNCLAGGSGSFAPQNAGPPNSSSSKPSGSKNDGEESILIEERRRKAGGDGYTVHKYMRGRLLGKGGFAKVYLCTAMETGKHYAMKIVPKANLVKERARQKLQTEIKIHRTLKHKNVCEYKHFFEDRENCYILLELCHNQSMNELIKRRKRLTEPEAAFFMDQMVAGVKYIHSNSVIHRDLKLGNLFLDKDLNIKVGDLGLATRLEDPEEKRKTICGTPNYIAPEVIQNDKSKRGHSFEVDIWSMGVVLYTILVGKPPYEAKDVKATYQRILANEYKFPEHIPLSESAMDLIESMLQTNPYERPSLEYISCHPFLSNRKLPASLPSSAMHFPPSWVYTDEGVFLADADDGGSIRSGKSFKSIQSQNSKTGSRRPFSRHDPNSQKLPPINSSKKVANEGRGVQRMVKNAFGLSSKAKQQGPSFKIYEETEVGQPEEAVSVAATQNVKAAKVTPQSVKVDNDDKSITSAFSMRFPSTDYDILKRMVKRLDTVLEVAAARRSLYRPQTPRPTVGLTAPEKWVTRYVDYTSKYGLGFLLNDGTSGVCFNDSTKTSLERDGDMFQYIERKRTEEGEAIRSDFVVSNYTLSDYPESLNKKVTLLKHFRNYLLEQQKKAKEELSFEAIFAEGSPSQFIYIKKWIRTKHAILFRLSDQTVQIVFYDQTEILLTPDDQAITYVDKNHSRKTYFLTDELVGTFAELEKRIKYSRDILQQLLSATR